MNFDQIKQKAENGCVQSAVQLAQHYYTENTAEAIKWAGSAADKNHVAGAFWMAKCLQREMKNMEDSDPAMAQKLQECYDWAEKAYIWFLDKEQGSESFQNNQLRKLLESAAFRLAYRMYEDGEFRAASAILKKERSHRCVLLMGLCMLRYYRKNDNAVEEDLYFACSCLSGVAQLKPGAQELCKEEAWVYTISALRYAKFRRIGLHPDGEKPSLKEAHTILQTVRSLIQNEELQKKLDDELALYRKNLFGQYKYLG